MEICAIWKFPIMAPGTCSIEMPADAKIVSAGLDSDGLVCVWAEVNPEATFKERHFAAIGTGWKIPCVALEKSTYLGHVLTQSGFVWHIYEVGRQLELESSLLRC